MTRFVPAPFRTARWSCIILVPLAWLMRSIRLRQQCDSFATTADSDLCSPAAEHVAARWRSSVAAEGIRNAEFRSYARRSELSRSLAEGHVGLVTQIPETKGAVVPSKSYGIMAAGRPVLYVGPQGATPASLIERHECGWRIEPGDTARAWSDF